MYFIMDLDYTSFKVLVSNKVEGRIHPKFSIGLVPKRFQLCSWHWDNLFSIIIWNFQDNLYWWNLIPHIRKCSHLYFAYFLIDRTGVELYQIFPHLICKRSKVCEYHCKFHYTSNFPLITRIWRNDIPVFSLPQLNLSSKSTLKVMSKRLEKTSITALRGTSEGRSE